MLPADAPSTTTVPTTILQRWPKSASLPRHEESHPGTGDLAVPVHARLARLPWASRPPGSTGASWQDRTKGRKGMNRTTTFFNPSFLGNSSLFSGHPTENFPVEISKHVLWCGRLGFMMAELLQHL